MAPEKKTKPVVADGIPVHCEHTHLEPTADLVPNPNNPNEHTERQIHLLAWIIRANGWRQAPVVSKRSGMIVKGHARREAAILLGVKVVPIDLHPYASEAEERADMIADNRIAELAHWDDEVLLQELQALQRDGVEVEGLGFPQEELDRLLERYDPETAKANEDALNDLAEKADELEPLDYLSAWKIGNSILVVCDVVDDLDTWKPYLAEDICCSRMDMQPR